MIVTTTFSTTTKISLQNQGCLKDDLSAKTKHAKLQYPSVCGGPQI